MGAATVPPTVRFTDHAQARMRERGITEAQVWEAVGKPWRTLTLGDRRREFQGWVSRGERRLLLRVIADDDRTVLTVVTVLATSKIAKYGAPT